MERLIVGKEAKTIDFKTKWDLLGTFIRQHGREAISYATLQQGMEYYINEMGYIAFTTVQHPILCPTPKRIVLCDPVCALEDYPLFLDRFIHNYPAVAFGVISENCAEELRKFGFKANCIGCEMILPVQQYNTAGNWKELDLIKRARNEMRRKNIVIREVNQEDLPNLHLEKVSESWLKTKKINDREIWIYARRPVFDVEPDMRKFVAFNADGDAVGFVFYDPIYKEGKPVGYSANTPRTDEQQFLHLTTAIHMTAIDIFRTEGIEHLNLCLSPFVNLQKGRYNEDKLLRNFFELTARYGGSIYNFYGLSFHKSKYRGYEVPIYFSSRSKMAMNEMYLAFHSAGISEGYFSTVGQILKAMIKSVFKKNK